MAANRWKRLWFVMLVWCASMAAVTARAADFQSPVDAIKLQDGDTVVFLGDSITHQCLYTQYVEDYYFTRFPQLKVRFHNAGVGGARARDALDRFDRDVAAYKPKYVTVLLGMNDGSYQPYDDKTFQTYRADMQELIKRIRDLGATPILMTPTMYDSRAARLRGGPSAASEPRLELYNSTLAYYGSWLREIAVESGAGFVDMYSPLNNLTLQQRKADTNFTMIKDAVHPDAPGQLVMAFALLEDMNSPRSVANIRAVVDATGKLQVTGAGGKATETKASDAGIEFIWTAESLPWVLPADTAVGAKLLRSGHRMSREALTVHGLVPGKYEFTIDNESVGIFTSEQLAAHIELQENERTPQYRLAMQVAELNKTRNDNAVRPLRNEWSQMQQLYRLRRQAEAEPNNTDLAKKLEEQTKKTDGLEDRIAKHEKTAAEIEQRIREMNVPGARKYRIARVELAQLSGVITRSGKPLANAEVLLIGEHGREARGKSNEAGKFVVRTGNVSGVIAGVYRIVIVGKDVPEKYSNPQTTALTYSVNRNTNDMNIEVH